MGKLEFKIDYAFFPVDTRVYGWVGGIREGRGWGGGLEGCSIDLLMMFKLYTCPL